MRGQRPSLVRLPEYSGTSDAPNAPPVAESLARMVWIGGAEPLKYPEIPRYANSLAAGGREVFLETDGALLRRRVHEFQPVPRFRFVFRFDGVSHNDAAVAAIRGAKLSGFLVCALTVVKTKDNFAVLAKLQRELYGLELDGYLIVPAVRGSQLDGALREARQEFLNRRWAGLSEMFESAVLGENGEAGIAERGSGENADAVVRLAPDGAAGRDCEEGAQA